jgi:hypothetical protein
MISLLRAHNVFTCFCLLFILCRCNLASASVLSNTTYIDEGIIRYHYDSTANRTNECSTILLIGVGTTMSVQDYDLLSIDIAKQNPDALVTIVDHAPGNPLKQSGERFARLVSAVGARVEHLFPMCFQQSLQQLINQTRPAFIIGGHSASGEAAIKSLPYLKGVSPTGLILLSPFRITSSMPEIKIPTLLWGFSMTTCLVDIRHETEMAYRLSSADSGRVLYQLQNPSGEPRHCIFTNHGCPLCPGSSSQRYAWVHPAVGESIAKYLVGVKTGTFTRKSMKLSLFPEEIETTFLRMFVGEDPIEAPSLPRDKEIMEIMALG